MNITEISIRRPVLAWMIMGATILLGVLAAFRIGISQYPDVDNPNVTVSVTWAGAAPQAVEREIAEPLEQALAQVEGIQQITSSSRQGSARITAVFDLSRNIDLALQDVQAKVAGAQRKLPRDVQSPTVSKSNPDDQPILTLGITGPFARQLLADVARYQVQEKLQTVSGVGQVTLGGYLDRNVRIWLDASRLSEKGVTVTDVQGALTREHTEVPAGSLEAGGRQVSVRVLGEAFDLDAFRHIVVKRQGLNPVYLSDVALVEDGFEDETSLALAGGVPLQTISILKQRGSNAVAVARQVQAYVKELEKTLPEGMKIEVLFDTTKFIEESVEEILIELALALVLTSLVCWLFLGSLSSTLNVVLAIPMSLLGTVGVIYFMGFTLNTFTLLGLSLAVGLVVDDAVMVLENIVRHGEMGKSSRVAALDGTKEITFAALAATVAVIAIFLPVIFMEGVVGRFFFQFGVTLSIAVALSYLEAITLAPARCAQMVTHGQARGRFGQLVERAFVALETGYTRALKRAMQRPVLVLFGGGLTLAGAVFLATQLKVEFVPSQDQSRLQLRLQTAAGASLRDAAPLLKTIEQKVMSYPEVERTTLQLSSGSGSMSITMVPQGKRKKTQAEFSAQLRKELGGYPGLRVSVQDLSQQAFSGGSKGSSPIELSVRGSDWDTLVSASMKLRDALVASGAAVDANTDYQVGSPEVQIVPDRRRASEMGVSAADIGTTVSALVGGSVVGKFTSAGRRIDIRMRLLADQRARPEDIGRLHVRTANGDLLPLSELVTQQEKPALQAISRIDRERAISITANVGPGFSQAQAIVKAQELAKDLPVGCRVVLGGQSVQLDQTTRSLLFALGIGILVAYMVLAAQFNSFLHPVTVLTILPLSVAGAIGGLFLSGHSLNVFSMIGLLLLMGIVKKNSIILVDYANQVRETDSLAAREAIERAGPLRLRPILMTTVATMMAAVPSALGLGPGAETRGPMAVAVLGGLALSTVLSLFVVPAFYVVTDRGKRAQPLEPAADPPAPHAAS